MNVKDTYQSAKTNGREGALWGELEAACGKLPAGGQSVSLQVLLSQCWEPRFIRQHKVRQPATSGIWALVTLAENVHSD